MPLFGSDRICGCDLQLLLFLSGGATITALFTKLNDKATALFNCVTYDATALHFMDLRSKIKIQIQLVFFLLVLPRSTTKHFFEKLYLSH